MISAALVAASFMSGLMALGAAGQNEPRLGWMFILWIASLICAFLAGVNSV
jgi:hypothetical protein